MLLSDSCNYFKTAYADQVLYTATRPLWKTFNLQCVVDDWITSAYANNGVVLWADNAPP